MTDVKQLWDYERKWNKLFEFAWKSSTEIVSIVYIFIMLCEYQRHAGSEKAPPAL